MSQLDLLRRSPDGRALEPTWKSPATPALPALPGREASGPRELSNLARHILAVLMEDAQGEANARVRAYVFARVRERLGLAVADAEMRVAKEELMEAVIPNLPCVGSGPKGYWICVTRAEHEKASKYLEDKGKDLCNKAHKIRQKMWARYGGAPLPAPVGQPR